MKILVTTTHLSKMIEKAINEDCNYFTLLPLNEKIHFVGTNCNFYEDINLSDKINVAATSYFFDNLIMNQLLRTLRKMEEQPILMSLGKTSIDKINFRLISQISDKVWFFSN